MAEYNPLFELRGPADYPPASEVGRGRFRHLFQNGGAFSGEQPPSAGAARTTAPSGAPAATFGRAPSTSGMMHSQAPHGSPPVGAPSLATSDYDYASSPVEPHHIGSGGYGGQDYDYDPLETAAGYSQQQHHRMMQQQRQHSVAAVAAHQQQQAAHAHHPAYPYGSSSSMPPAPLPPHPMYGGGYGAGAFTAVGSGGGPPRGGLRGHAVHSGGGPSFATAPYPYGVGPELQGARQRGPRILSRFKTKLCSFFMDSNGAFCPHGASCQFAHGYGDLRGGAGPSGQGPAPPSPHAGPSPATQHASAVASQALALRQQQAVAALAAQQQAQTAALALEQQAELSQLMRVGQQRQHQLAFPAQPQVRRAGGGDEGTGEDEEGAAWAFGGLPQASDPLPTPPAGAATAADGAPASRVIGVRSYRGGPGTLLGNGPYHHQLLQLGGTGAEGRPSPHLLPPGLAPLPGHPNGPSGGGRGDLDCHVEDGALGAPHLPLPPFRPTQQLAQAPSRNHQKQQQGQQPHVFGGQQPHVFYPAGYQPHDPHRAQQLLHFSGAPDYLSVGTGSVGGGSAGAPGEHPNTQASIGSRSTLSFALGAGGGALPLQQQQFSTLKHLAGDPGIGGAPPQQTTQRLRPLLGSLLQPLQDASPFPGLAAAPSAEEEELWATSGLFGGGSSSIGASDLGLGSSPASSGGASGAGGGAAPPLPLSQASFGPTGNHGPVGRTPAPRRGSGSSGSSAGRVSVGSSGGVSGAGAEGLGPQLTSLTL